MVRWIEGKITDVVWPKSAVSSAAVGWGFGMRPALVDRGCHVGSLAQQLPASIQSKEYPFSGTGLNTGRTTLTGAIVRSSFLQRRLR